MQAIGKRQGCNAESGNAEIETTDEKETDKQGWKYKDEG
jgi:hypothetical protein